MCDEALTAVKMFQGTHPRHSMRNTLRRPWWLPAVLVAALWCLPAARALPSSESATIKTKAGPIVGVRSSLGVSYRGVQYATAKRWQAPQPPPSFTTPFDANAGMKRVCANERAVVALTA